MHVGRVYQYANLIRVLGVGVWDWPAFPAKNYDFTAPTWVDQLGVGPVPGTHRSADVVYNTGDRFAYWDTDIPCNAGHTVTVRMTIELTTLGIGINVTGKVIVDSVERGQSGIVVSDGGGGVDWGDWGGDFGTTVAPQNLGATFPSHVAVAWP